MSKNQDVIQNQVHQHSPNARRHGNQGLPRLSQCSGIGIGQSEGQQAKEHHLQVIHAIAQKQPGILHLPLSLEI